MKRVTDVLHELKIPYFVGGSMASSLYGIPRTTQDVDIIADIKENHIVAFAKKLKDKFYVDEEMIKDAIHRKASFNIIFLEAIFKVDIFVLKADKYSQTEMERREIYDLSDNDSIPVYLASPEDIIINKLRWYQSGGKSGAKQWDDILGVIRVREQTLNYVYLEENSKNCGISELLQEAIAETKN